jgi:phosphoribosylformylglycinamidine cyclo-ligase
VKLATQAGRFAGIGRDIVNHCVNDILVQGAEPLFFLDYYGTGELNPAQLAEVVEGISEACRENGAALIGGETAEMPGVYPEGVFDLVGTIVGIVDRSDVLDGSRVEAGDRLIGLASDGFHTNGYSLIRSVLLETGRYQLSDRVAGIDGTLGDYLLLPHRSYLKELAMLLKQRCVSGMAHITGGGLTDNLPRVLPAGTVARVRLGSWPIPSAFRLVQREAQASEAEMFRTFNMGIGMVVITAPDHADEVCDHVSRCGLAAWQIGSVESGTNMETRVCYGS